MPYVKNHLLTYDDFEKIFNDFTRREQYEILEVLYYEQGIELVDEIPYDLINADTSSMSFEQSKTIEESVEEPIFINKNIKQSNEILCSLIQEGNQQAKQDLCVKNEYLVMKYALGYNKFLGNDLSVDDLKQAGMMGILEAAKRFNPTLGYSFSTYAVIWIKQAITREIYDKGFRVRIPVHIFEKINKINSLDSTLFLNGETNYNLRLQKIASSMEISVDYLKKLILIRETCLNNISLDMPINEDGDTTLVEMIPIEEEATCEEKVTFLELRKILSKVLSMLKPKEAKVLKLRFGLDDGITYTLEAIGKYFGLTRERIRQIETKALDKLRKSGLRNKLDGYID